MANIDHSLVSVDYKILKMSADLPARRESRDLMQRLDFLSLAAEERDEETLQ